MGTLFNLPGLVLYEMHMPIICLSQLELYSGGMETEDAGKAFREGLDCLKKGKKTFTKVCFGWRSKMLQDL